MTPSRPRTEGTDQVGPLQQALAGEHAAVYLFGLLGARSSRSRNPTLFSQLSTGFEEHRQRRDAVSALIDAAGGTPVAAEVAYRPPGPIETPAQLAQVALEIERRLTATYGRVIEHTAGEHRRFAIAALQQCAVRQLGFGGAPTPLPGSAGGASSFSS